MLSERGVSYYGVYDGRKASGDFADMLDGGLNAVLLAMSEFDYWFWKEGVKGVLKEARRQNLSAYLDIWGWGKTFGGEPGSIFVQKNPGELQVSRSGHVIPAACVNSSFRQFVVDSLKQICEEMEFDGIFLDEPHYARIKDGWGCYCEKCRRLFKERYERDMDTQMTEGVVEFREDSMLGFLADAIDVVKAAGKRVILCMLPFEGEKRRLVGAPDWHKISALDVDVLATDPYWITFGEQMRPFVKRQARRMLEACRKTGKKAQMWVQLFNVPAGRESEIEQGMELIKKADFEGKTVDSIFGWPYLAGENSILASDNPDLVWKTFLTALRP
ncbi:MAG: hypothetical protein ACE5IO_05760 [Thermoplasmata archaeon]